MCIVWKLRLRSSHVYSWICLRGFSCGIPSNRDWNYIWSFNKCVNNNFTNLSKCDVDKLNIHAQNNYKKICDSLQHIKWYKRLISKHKSYFIQKIDFYLKQFVELKTGEFIACPFHILIFKWFLMPGVKDLTSHWYGI